MEDESPREVNLPTLAQKNLVGQFMESGKPFLNPNLSIGQLARQTGISTRELYHIINHGFNKNFFDFVGNYRISHARLLLEISDSGKTILEVMYESGFNSKSVFNTAFKQETGMTPSQYRSQKS